MKTIVDLFGKNPIDLKTRVFLKARSLQTPYLEMAQMLPRQGPILDMACGHGLLSFSLALDSKSRKITGVDIDSRRIETAKNLSEKMRNDGYSLQFFQGSQLDFLKNSQESWSGIALIDSLHYLKTALQDEILRLAYEKLAPGGVFILREVNSSDKAKSKLNKIHEFLATQSGFTKAERLEFQTPQVLLEKLNALGFEIETKLMNRWGFSDFLFKATKLEQTHDR